MKTKLEKATAGYKGKCLIWVEYCYSLGTFNAPEDGFLPSDWGEGAEVFDSYDDAEEWIEDNTGGTYYLANGEMGAPTYKIVKY